MRTSYSTAIALLAVFIGFAAGHYVASHDYKDAFHICSVDDATRSLDEATSRLGLLLRGDTNAVMQELDLQLNRETVMLQELLDQYFPEARRKTNAAPFLGHATRALERARAFRKAQPSAATPPNKPMQPAPQ
jgi:hypothetical protein